MLWPWVLSMIRTPKLKSRRRGSEEEDSGDSGNEEDQRTNVDQCTKKMQMIILIIHDDQPECILSQFTHLPLPFEPPPPPQLFALKSVFWKECFPPLPPGFSREYCRKIMIFSKVNIFTKNILRHLKGLLVEHWAATG